ncbi:MAG: DUF6036 family nucleotidyltransferase [Gemmatimonadales bacterium]
MPDPAPFDPERILSVLGQHAVEFVLVGALAARLQGFPRLTADADVTPANTPENLVRLAAALRELEARVYTESVPEGLPFDCSGPTLGRADLWNLVSAAGRIDLILRPSGTTGYEELRLTAIHFDFHGVPLLVASLEDILRSKMASDRPQDRQDAMVIREILAADRARDAWGK